MMPPPSALPASLNVKPSDNDKRSSISHTSNLSAQGWSRNQREPSYDDPLPPPSRLRRIVDSFKEHEGPAINGTAVDAYGIEQMQLEEGIKHDGGRLARKLKGRHLQMIAIGGSIG